MILTQTPLRISFAGGGTDFRGFYKERDGLVISTTIDKYIVVMVKQRFDEKIVLHYSETEVVNDAKELRHNIIRECLGILGVKRQIEISTTADIPSTGSGLGASSTLAVGVLHALAAYQGILLTEADLAQQACHVEIGKLKAPIGKQDQYEASYGGLNLIEFHADETVEIESLRPAIEPDIVAALERNLLLFYTSISRQASDILATQKASIADKIDTLSAMAQLAKDMAFALSISNLDKFGQLMHDAWSLKRTMTSEISNPKVDDIYGAARRAGALGGKVCGAGGGGFMLFYCPVERQARLRQALKPLYELPFQFDQDGSKVIFNNKR